jgi:hypothetical protein
VTPARATCSHRPTAVQHLWLTLCTLLYVYHAAGGLYGLAGAAHNALQQSGNQYGASSAAAARAAAAAAAAEAGGLDTVSSGLDALAAVAGADLACGAIKSEPSAGSGYGLHQQQQQQLLPQRSSYHDLAAAVATASLRGGVPTASALLEAVREAQQQQQQQQHALLNPLAAMAAAAAAAAAAGGGEADRVLPVFQQQKALQQPSALERLLQSQHSALFGNAAVQPRSHTPIPSAPLQLPSTSHLPPGGQLAGQLGALFAGQGSAEAQTMLTNALMAGLQSAAAPAAVPAASTALIPPALTTPLLALQQLQAVTALAAFSDPLTLLHQVIHNDAPAPAPPLPHLQQASNSLLGRSLQLQQSAPQPVSLFAPLQGAPLLPPQQQQQLRQHAPAPSFMQGSALGGIMDALKGVDIQQLLGRGGERLPGAVASAPPLATAAMSSSALTAAALAAAAAAAGLGVGADAVEPAPKRARQSSVHPALLGAAVGAARGGVGAAGRDVVMGGVEDAAGGEGAAPSGQP